MNRRVETKVDISNQGNEVSSLHLKSTATGTVDQIHTEISKTKGYYYSITNFSKHNFDSYDCYFYPHKVVCEICSKSFSKRCNLNTHVRIEHEKQRYKCTDCEKLFKSAYALEKHASNPMIHEVKSRRLEKEPSKTVLKEDADFGLSPDEKNNLILKLKQRIAKLKTCNSKYRSEIVEFKNEVKTLRLSKTKSNHL